MDRKPATWFMALAAGALAAAVAALPVPPLAAFAGGAILGLVAAIALRARPRAAPVPEPAAVPPPPAPTGRADAMPTAFGRALIEKLPTPLLVVTLTGRILYANPAAQAALARLQPDAHF